MEHDSNPIILPATPDDADAIASLHAHSWQTAYAGILPDHFLQTQVRDDRMSLWRARFGGQSGERLATIKAVRAGEIVGFACVVFDVNQKRGPMLDNLHVHPMQKRLGIGKRLFSAARAIAASDGEARFHLWVLEANLPARQFYDSIGGTPLEIRRIEVVPHIVVPEICYLWESEHGE